MTVDLIVIVPTRSRPENVSRVVEAWRVTGAFVDRAELHFAVDGDDPAYPRYVEQLDAVRAWLPDWEHKITWSVHGTWRPLVPKLNAAAADLALFSPFALGFAGDDHVPRTPHWVRAYVDALRAGAGIVYGDDGYQHENLPTEWAMRTEIVNALGRMVPAPVDHLYCDNSIRELGRAAGLLRYLPDVTIEHMHPSAGKAPTDAQYDRVNGPEQYAGDRAAYREWKRSGLHADAARLVNMIKGETTS